MDNKKLNIDERRLLETYNHVNHREAIFLARLCVYFGQYFWRLLDNNKSLVISSKNAYAIAPKSSGWLMYQKEKNGVWETIMPSQVSLVKEIFDKLVELRIKEEK